MPETLATHKIPIRENKARQLVEWVEIAHDGLAYTVEYHWPRWTPRGTEDGRVTHRSPDLTLALLDAFQANQGRAPSVRTLVEYVRATSWGEGLP